MAVVDSERVAHGLERQAGVLTNTRWMASTHRHRSPSSSPTSIVLTLKALRPDLHCAPTTAGCFADAFDNDGAYKTLCQILLTIPWSLTQTLGSGSSILRFW